MRADDAEAARRAERLFSLMRHAFLAGCEAFENKSPWATPEDLFKRYMEDIADGIDPS